MIGGKDRFAVGSAGLEQELDRRSFLDALQRFLDTLSHDAGVIFVRRYWYAESVGQIAGRFGIRENTAAQILRRIRKKLKDYLTREGFTV